MLDHLINDDETEKRSSYLVAADYVPAYKSNDFFRNDLTRPFFLEQ